MSRTYEGRISRTIAESTPHWPAEPKAPVTAPEYPGGALRRHGFSDFGCYDSPIKTPTIDRLAAEGLRYTGLHTTAMCSTTRAAMLTGRNPHSVGVSSLANFDSGYRGYAARSGARLEPSYPQEAEVWTKLCRPFCRYLLGRP
jgi:arylsulfatase